MSIFEWLLNTRLLLLTKPILTVSSCMRIRICVQVGMPLAAIVNIVYVSYFCLSKTIV